VPAETMSPSLALLLELDSVGSNIGVWKNATDALRAQGDIDYFAPRNLWPAILATFRSWADAHGFEHLPPCLHRPGTMYLLAVDHVGGRLMQLDVRERLTVSGSEVIDANGLGALLVETGHGFKTLRPGAEATLKMLLKCIDGRGRLQEACLADESVASGIVEDLGGAHATAGLLARGGHNADRLVKSIAGGHPDRASARSFWTDLRMDTIRRPATLTELAIYRLRRRLCPVLRWILSHGQQLPTQADEWITDVRRVHANADAWLYLDMEPKAAVAAPGQFVVIAGPDGVGKTTLREALAETLRPDHAVWSGRLSGPLTDLRRTKRPRQSNSGPPARGRTVSTLKILYLFLDALLRWFTWTRSWLKGGGWVLTERGWWDIAVYPARYGVGRSGRLHTMLGLLAPRPNLILILEADAATIRGRKQELSPSEMLRQARAWRSVIPRRQPHIFLDAALPPGILVERTLAAIEEGSEGPVTPFASV
jgi:thymidylate kinase